MICSEAETEYEQIYYHLDIVVGLFGGNSYACARVIGG